MRVVMMKVMAVSVLMAERRVAMAVFMRFAEMKVEPDRHQQPGEDELPGDVLAKQPDRQDRADEGSGCKIGTGARGSKVTQGENEEHQTDAIAEEADHGGGADLRWSGQRPAVREAKAEGRHTRAQAFDQCDLHRIGRAEFARQVVVDPPGDAGTDDRHGADTHSGRAGMP